MNIKGIGIISPSTGNIALYPKRVKRGENYLKDCGFQVKFSTHSGKNLRLVSASAVDRVSDIYSFLNDDDINIIISSIGGYNCNHLLPLLNYEKIIEMKKIFVGYSDISTLLIAIYIKTGVPVLHGPTFLPEFCEYPNPYTDTMDSFINVLTKSEVAHTFAGYQIKQYVDWSEEENNPPIVKAREYSDCWQVLMPGEAFGILIGGNLQALSLLYGSEYLPEGSFDDKIVFFEDCNQSVPIIDSMLTSLKLKNAFLKIKGFIWGRSPYHEVNEQISNVLINTLPNNIPIVYNVDIGHTNPKISIPIGLNALLFSDIKNTIILKTEGLKKFYKKKENDQ